MVLRHALRSVSGVSIVAILAGFGCGQAAPATIGKGVRGAAITDLGAPVAAVASGHPANPVAARSADAEGQPTRATAPTVRIEENDSHVFRLVVQPVEGESDDGETTQAMLEIIDKVTRKKQKLEIDVTAGVRNGDAAWIDFTDFNFDGHADLSIYVGNQGPHGSPSHDLYAFEPGTNRFAFSSDFTDLDHASLGGIEVDPKHQRVSVASKSGCCYHTYEEYAVRAGAPLLMRRETMDALTTANACTITVEERDAHDKLVSSTSPCPP